MNNAPVMPRRRGSLHNSSARRAATSEDARNGGKSGAVKGNRKSSMTNHKEAETVDPSATPAAPSACSKSGATTVGHGTDSPSTNAAADGAGADSGYLHKKFKKVAAAVMRDEPEAGIGPAGRTPPPPAVSSSTSQVAPSPVAQLTSESTPMVLNEIRETTAPATSVANVTANQKALDNGSIDVTAPAAPAGTTRTKSGRYVCPYCQHACAKPSVLEKHIRAHTNERPYPCVPCGFAFKTKSNLYKHCKSRTHVLKVEESGAADPGANQPTDAGSDTSDDLSNVNEGQDSDDVDGVDAPAAPASGNNNNISSSNNNNNNVPLMDAVQQNGVAESSTTPEKFKTPYKPKFHVFKPLEDGGGSAPGVVPAALEERPDANSVNCDSGYSGTSGTSGGVPASRPQLASLQARISQIISENQAIVETKDPIWPRRYVRQSSRDKDSPYATSVANNKVKVSTSAGDVVLTSSPAAIHQRMPLTSRERSSSLSLVSNVDPSSLDLSRSALTIPPHRSSLVSAGGSPSRTFSPNNAPSAPPGGSFAPKMIHHIEVEELHRKRCYSEGPENAMRHSVRHILQPSASTISSQAKVSRSDSIAVPSEASNPTLRPESYPGALAHPPSQHPQNPEGSIIKDLLLKSRGMLTSADVKEVDVPAKMTSSSASSFSVSALLNSTTSARSGTFAYQQMASEASRSAPELDLADGSDERPTKKAKLSPELPVVIRPVELVNTMPVVSSGAYSVRNLPLGGEDQLNRRTPTRSSSLQLFGGEVEICDGGQRTVLRIDPGGFTPETSASASSSAFSSVGGGSSAAMGPESASSSIVVTISKSGLNTGGGVVQVQNREPATRLTPLPLNISFECATTTSSSVSEDRPGGVIVKSSRNKPELDGLVSMSPFPTNLKTQIHQVPYVPGIPGPYSLSNWLPRDSTTTVTASYASHSAGSHVTTTMSLQVPQITINPPTSASVGSPSIDEGPRDAVEEMDGDGGDSCRSMKFLRPNSLPLKPGTFQLKKSSMAGIDGVGVPNMVGSGGGGTLISPETPRPRKLYRQLYLNGHAYTYLGLKCSTRVYYCCLSRSQPMYVLQCDPKLSMYSQWKTRPCAADSSPLGVGPVEAMSLYDSRHRPASFTTAQSRDGTRMILTHSTYWTNRDRPTSANVKPEVSSSTPVPPTATPVTMAPLAAEDDKSAVKGLTIAEPEKKPEPQEEAKVEVSAAPVSARSTDGQPKRVRIFAGGFKSNEDYTYVRGRGRGRYVCEECGIRCKKPSMLKKHIRTHTDLRPYTCRQCNFSFKTKGNLTKHMKSKAHHKKCTELGIVPVPTTVEEANIDEDSLARQETLKKLSGSKSDADSELDDDEEDDDEDEDDEGEEEEEEVEYNDNGTPEISGQFEDAVEADPQPEVTRPVPTAARGETEHEVARSLLDLGVLAPAGSKPTTYPYATHWNPPESAKESAMGSFEDAKPIDRAEEEKHKVQSIQLPEIPQPHPPQQPPQQASVPMDLSTTRSVKESPPTPTVATSNEILSPVTQPSSLLASIYLTAQKVQEASVRRNLEPASDSGDAHSGMLQAYLTEKALKEGLMKSKQQIKECPASGASVAAVSSLSPKAEAKSGAEGRPNVIHPPNSSASRSIFGESMTVSGVKGRPEVFVVPSTTCSSSSASSASSLGGASAYRMTDDGKTACSICNKVFTKPSQLRLHINIHYFERPFRCEACAVSFRTKGHLQKHKRSVTHFNKVNMNLTFGTPSSENPRPFKCSDCMIAFRIHGHLAKHLRSKMHIMKLECLGKLPFGTYAEMERSGINLNEIDTTDCHNSLESLQSLAHRLYKQDPSKLQQWQQEAQVAAEANMRERTISGSSEEFSDAADMDGDDLDEDGEDSDGLPDAVVESIPHQPVSHHPPPPQQTYNYSARKCEPEPMEPREASYLVREEMSGRPEGSHHQVANQPPQLSPPLQYVPDPVRAPPPMYCSACGEACSSNEAFQIHVMEKHRPPSVHPPSHPPTHPPSNPPARQPIHSPAHPSAHPLPVAPPTPTASSNVKEMMRTPSPMETSPLPSRPLELSRNSSGAPPEVRREVEYERSPPRPVEAKLTQPHHWNRNSEMASSFSQRPVYYHPGSGPPPPAALPPHSALSMWPRPPSGYAEFMNPIPGMPPHWPQDPAAMAWIHHRLMMPMAPSGAPHPHSYMPTGHLAPGVNGTRMSHSPTSSSSATAPPEDLVFACDICGKGCPSKDTLRQHMLAHAQPRPFVCEHCDAGFTTQQHLESHLILHRPRTS